jgi:hypothetical protein
MMSSRKFSLDRPQRRARGAFAARMHATPFAPSFATSFIAACSVALGCSSPDFNGPSTIDLTQLPWAWP